ncbi:MAG: FAD-dependent oxidoreductase [Planctomycetes bacterium]|nr:FAD-dependent oxidoreductase [Planctomycetota bacterium]
MHGLCTAFALRRAGLRRLAVLEAHGPGHDRGSSHGLTRITRSSYHEPRFVRLAIEAHRAWSALESALGGALRVPTPGLFFGPRGGRFDAYLAATLGSGAAVEQIAVAQARHRFPLLRLADDDRVLIDHTAAMVLAAETMSRLRSWLQANGVELRWHSAATQLRDGGRTMQVETTGGSLQARRVVLATGPWLDRLAGAGLPGLLVLRQTIGYFDLDAPAAATRAGTFPVWARIGRTAEEFDYGLPEHGGVGLKLARHRTAGAADDPDAAAPPIDPAPLLALAQQRFAVPVRGLQRAERCLYTMSADQDLRVEPHPRWPRVVTIAACSGHGFKFGPVIGQQAAERSLAIAD